MPLIKGQRITARIEDIAFGGEGVGRVEGMVVFVPFVLVGEEVTAEITEVKKAFARARLIEVLTRSPDRVEPECRYFGACGGCQYQHVAYATQLTTKRKQVADLFERIGGLDRGAVQPTLPCPAPYGYRNRIMVRSQWNKPEQKLNIGFVRHDCGLVEDIEECRIAEPALSAMIADVRRNPPPRGGIKVAMRLPPEGWEVPPDSFFQNNFHLLPGLVNAVRERLREAGTRHLVDIYCGVGFFGIELAGDVESFAGVEYDKQAIRAARTNAAARGIANGEFIEGKAEDSLASLLGRFPAGRTTALIDPPRKGCQPAAIEALRESHPHQLLYISCHPATMARDLKALCDDLYELRLVVPVDMFPQTQHIECVADLRLRSPAGAG